MLQLTFEKTCESDGCQKPPRCRGLCATHYAYWRKKNRDKVNRRPGRWDNPDGSRMECFKPECTDPVETQGLCRRHYQHFHYESTRGREVGRKNRNLSKPGGIGPQTCTFKGCSNPEFNPGWCAGHYYQKLQGRVLRPLNEMVPCRVARCDKEVTVRKTSRGLCPKHSGECRRFSLTPDQLVDLYVHYECSNPKCTVSEKLHIDHDHSCCPRGRFKGAVKSCGRCIRGWLCHGCNASLGLLKEDRERIQGLVEFLDRSRS